MGNAKGKELEMLKAVRMERLEVTKREVKVGNGLWTPEAWRALIKVNGVQVVTKEDSIGT